jgi:hypothetical protein
MSQTFKRFSRSSVLAQSEVAKRREGARNDKLPDTPKPSMKEWQNRNIILYAPLFIGVSVGVTALGNGMQEGGK